MLFNWIRSYGKEIQVKEYLENISKFEEYEDVLENPELYAKYDGEYKILGEEEKDYMKVRLYDKYGFNLYSSVANDIPFNMDKERLYQGLYEVRQGGKYDSLKRPVYKNGNIVGVYEMTILRTGLIREVNKRTTIAISLFILNFIIVLVIVNKMINRKINRPLNLLVNSMEGFGTGENIHINYKSNDEIGELIYYFNNMKDEIEEKNMEIKEQQKSKEYMTAAISHDLKSPLTAIRAYTELLDSRGDLDDKNNKFRDIILKKCDYMSNMLEDLLTFTLLTRDYKMEFVNVEGQEFFEMLISGYEEVCQRQGLKYESQVKVNGKYRFDVNQMMRVVDNLVSNAIRHSTPGGKISVGAFSEDMDLPDWLDESYKDELESFRKDGAILIVKNNGEEIKEEDMKNILEPFYKADSSRKNIKMSGTGLGLSIVNLIIEKHSGKVKILSHRDKGTVIGFVVKKWRGKDV